ncbi:MAG: peroxiredoxin [Pseudomonadota bacterium]
MFALPGGVHPRPARRSICRASSRRPPSSRRRASRPSPCVSVNDAFVMDAWGKAQGAGDKVMMIADGNGDFTRAMGLELDGTANGLGKRSQRYSMVVDNGVIKQLNVEAPRAFEVSSADHMLKQL